MKTINLGQEDFSALETNGLTVPHSAHGSGGYTAVKVGKEYIAKCKTTGKEMIVKVSQDCPICLKPTY